MTIEERLKETLEKKGMHISFAESCTGGLAAARLVSVSGSSAVFDGSFVTYANSAKEQFVGVSHESIAAYGVVSEVVAREMAQGCARALACEAGVGISGIAGPEGGTPKKPVGTVCFGFYVNGSSFAETQHFDGDRTAVRNAAATYALTRVCELIEQA